MKLQSKIHLYSSVLFAVLIIAASSTIYFTFSRISIQHELDQIKAETLQSASAIRQWSEQAAVEELLRAYVPINGMIAFVRDGNQPPVTVTSSTETHLGKRELTFSPQEQTDHVQVNGNRYGFVSVPFIGADGQVANVQMMVNLADLFDLLDILRIVLIIVVIGVMIPALFSSGVLGRLITQPITEMTQTIKEIIHSGKFVRLKQDGHSKDELLEMGQSFNEMIALLENNFAKQEQFLSNASHELKTPLTIIESYASLLKRRGREKPELLEESVEAIHSEAQRMKALTEQLLLLAKPNKQLNVRLKEIELVSLVQKNVANFRKAYDREIIIHSPHDDQIKAYTDGEMFSQLLIIFLDNARKYSEESITIEIESDDDDAVIRISDRGVGIPKEEQDRVFERFYRVDKARGRNEQSGEGGSGLGLSLAQEIADAIGIEIDLASVERLGTTVTLRISNSESALSKF